MKIVYDVCLHLVCGVSGQCVQRMFPNTFSNNILINTMLYFRYVFTVSALVCFMYFQPFSRIFRNENMSIHFEYMYKRVFNALHQYCLSFKVKSSAKFTFYIGIAYNTCLHISDTVMIAYWDTLTLVVKINFIENFSC